MEPWKAMFTQYWIEKKHTIAEFFLKRKFNQDCPGKNISERESIWCKILLSLAIKG